MHQTSISAYDTAIDFHQERTFPMKAHMTDG
jgi:hypothetical protein